MRDLTRYRIKTVQARTCEIQRLATALESAGIKLGSVASGITGQRPTAMIEALTGGERRGPVMADLAKGRARTAAKLAGLPAALEGRFTEHHALMRRLILDRIKIPGAAVADLDTRIKDKAAPWQRRIDLLKTIPGFGDVVAWAWIAEIGPAPHQWFASSGKPASRVSLAPGSYISAGKRKHSRTGDAGTYIKPALVQAAWAAVKGRGRPQDRCNRLVRRFGGPKNPGAKKKAIVAIAHTLLKIACAVLKAGTGYQDLGAGFCTRREPAAQRQAWLERQLQELHPGCAVTVTVTRPPAHPPEAALPPAPDPPATPQPTSPGAAATGTPAPVPPDKTP